MVHDMRKVRKAVQTKIGQGTPRRWALGEVQSTTTGVAQITVDGGNAQIPAFIPVGLTLAAGNVVGVELVGAKAFIVQRYS